MPPKRSRTLDVLRGLLFVLMTNTHALSLVGMDEVHQFLGDTWLPNGWATVVYVVLSGYSIGWVFSARHPSSLHIPLLCRRSAVILAVMLLSNSFFEIAKLVQQGDHSAILDPDWWIGFLTLATPWSISGVLLPTALVLLCAPALIALCRKWPWQTLAALLLAQVAVNLSGLLLGASAYSNAWAVRFFFREGLGGFPVLPFVLNGCIGCWLGIYRLRNESIWLYGIGLLLLLQLCAYASTFAPPAFYWSVFRNTAGPIGKFGWVFLCASLLMRFGFTPMVSALALIGKFALTTFVAHRIFLHLLDTTISGLGLGTMPPALHYFTLWLGTLALSWALCVFLQVYYGRSAPPGVFPNKVASEDETITRWRAAGPSDRPK